jgi:hypothetical protein
MKYLHEILIIARVARIRKHHMLHVHPAVCFTAATLFCARVYIIRFYASDIKHFHAHIYTQLPAPLLFIHSNAAENETANSAISMSNTHGEKR